MVAILITKFFLSVITFYFIQFPLHLLGQEQCQILGQARKEKGVEKDK